MLYYTEAEVKSFARKIVGKDIQGIIPIGNHELKRNLVYHIVDESNRPLVFKLYYKKNRWNREVASLKLLERSSVKHPKLIGEGILDDGTEWCLMEYIEGVPLVKVLQEIPQEEILEIMEEMGHHLGKIHSIGTFDYFGNWDEAGKPLEPTKNFREIITSKIEANLEDLFKLDLPEEGLFKEAADELRKNYDAFNLVKEARLCHQDYDARNLLVKKVKGKWVMTAVIDFEQSYPWDKDSDLKNLYHTLFMDHPRYKEAFFRGYEEHMGLGDDFESKMRAHLLYLGLNICSWTNEQAPDYYRNGVDLLKRLMKF